MEIEILIDEITDCLIERETGKIIQTEFKKKDVAIKKSEYRKWKFDWKKTQQNGYTIYELFLKDDSVVQGRISLKIDGGVANVDIVETAPQNYGHNGKYAGIGAHLFAIACLCSLEAGCDGVVAFTSKSDLVEYYKDKLGATEIMPRRLVIFEEAAQSLINTYLRK